MKVAELRELLENAADDDEVRVATQPSWPLRLELSHVVTPDDRRSQDVEFEDDDEPEDDDDNVVWLVTGSHPHDESPYAPRALWEF